MLDHFQIVGGIVYLDKGLYTDSLKVDNDISKLTGSTCMRMFRAQPHISYGPESVVIDYYGSECLMIDQDPELYIKNLQNEYHRKVRGHLIMDIGEGEPVDMLINRY